MTRSELIAMINLVYQAVDHSNAGPIQGSNEMGQTVYYNLGRDTFLTVLQQVMPKGEMRAVIEGDVDK